MLSRSQNQAASLEFETATNVSSQAVFIKHLSLTEELMENL